MGRQVGLALRYGLRFYGVKARRWLPHGHSMTGSTLAYVVGGHAKDIRGNGNLPRAEFEVFLERFGGELLDYSALDESRSPLAYLLRRVGLAHVALATVVAARHRLRGAFVVSGEDVGIPLALALSIRRSRSLVFIITHGSYFGSKKFRFLMNILKYLRRTHFLCLSESLRAFMVQGLGATESQVHNCSYGVDTEFFQPTLSAPSTPPLIVSAGLANRDYETLVSAVSSLPVQLRIAADSRWFPAESLATGSESPPNVDMSSCGDYASLRALYGDASIVVVPLRNATFACGYAVIIEAMAMGKVVIATRTDVAPDFIIHGVNGFYIEVGGVTSLRRLVGELLDDPDRCLAIGHAARASVINHFSLDLYCDRIKDVVQIGSVRDTVPTQTTMGG